MCRAPCVALDAAPIRPPATDPWHDLLEEQAFLPGAAPECVRQAMCAAFAGQGWLTVTALGRRWFARAQDHPETARVHSLVALAAYNQRVGTNDAEDRFTHQLGEHLAAALAGEQDPTRRAQLLYRWGIHVGRRGGQLEAAAAVFDQALDSVATDPLDRAWCFNGRAYIRMRRGDRAGAIADTRAAIDAARGPLRVPGEALGSRAILHANLALLLAQGGRPGEAARALRVARAPERRFLADAPAYSGAIAVGIALARNDWRGAAECAERWAAATVVADLPEESVEAHRLSAALYAHLGDPAAATAARRAALAVLMPPPGPFPTVDLPEAALAELLALATDAARLGLDPDPKALPDELVFAAQALAAAVRGDRAAADSAGNGAIARVADGGHLAGVLLLLGEALDRLRRPAQARVVWQQLSETAASEAVRWRARGALAGPADLPALLAEAPRHRGDVDAWPALRPLARKCRRAGVYTAGWDVVRAGARAAAKRDSAGSTWLAAAASTTGRGDPKKE